MRGRRFSFGGRIIVLLFLAAIASSLPLTVQRQSPLAATSGTLRIPLSPIQASPSTSVVGTNIPVVGEAAPDRQQVETTIAVDPRNPSIIVAGAQDLRLTSSGEHRWHGYYRSTDGGQTWSSSLLPGYPGDTSPQGMSSPLHRSNATSDPVLAFDRMGNLYYAGLVLNISAAGPGGNGPAVNVVTFVAKYINDGATYSNVTLIVGPINHDKPWITVDNSGGPSDGNVYLVFDANLTATSPFATLLTRSTDGGKTFSPPFYVPSDHTGELPGVTVDPAGNVYVSSDAFDPITEANLNYIQVSKVINGGTSLVQNVKAVNPADWVTSGSTIGANFRAFTIPQMAADASGVYLVFDDLRLGNSSVFIIRSTDGGTSWTAPLRVNDELGGQHFFPTIAVSGGIVNVAWYDSRLNTATPITNLDVYYSNSIDGGVSFSPNVRVTNVSFNPEIVLRTDGPYPDQFYPFIGDYVGIAATSINAYPLWADNRFACDTFDTVYSSCVDQDAFTAAISLPDYAITANPTTQTIMQGASGASNLTLTSLNGFQGSVNVTSSSSPSGLPISPATKIITLPANGTGSFNLTFAPITSTVPTTYTVSITSVGGPRSHPAQITVIVNPSQSVGGTVVPVDKLSLLLNFLPAAITILLTGGFIAVKAWSKSKRRGAARIES
jgi:hypothetical protein